jgi:O-antigen/teichoic acid export membrane protein
MNRAARPGPALHRALPPVYAAAALRLAFPLIALPLVAARLGAEEFGRLSLMLVWAGVLALVVEGGFLAAATRLAVAADAAGRWALARQVFSARCALSGLALLLACALVPWLMPGATLAQRAASVALLAALGCSLGWPATWYLQASAQLHRWARVELVVYGLWLLLTLALAHSVAAYLLLQIAATTLLAGLGWWRVRHDLAPLPGLPTTTKTKVLPQALWSPAAVAPGLRLGAAMLPVALAGAAYSFALPAVAAGQLARSELGLYYLADRVVRALLAAADPVYQLVFPRIVARMPQGLRAAAAYSARWALLGALAGGLLLLAGALAWPLLAPWLAARSHEEATGLRAVFGVLGWLLPLLLGWKFFGYWMLGSGRFDGAYRACLLVGGVVGVLAALAFAHLGAVALAGVALGAEVTVIASALVGVALTLRSAARRARP